MQIVDKIANILELLSGGEELTVSEISNRIDLPMPTAHRLLSALTAKGMLEKDGKTKRYSLGWTLVRYAKCVRQTSENKYAIKKLTPIMQELSRTTGETVTLAAFMGTRIVLISVLDGIYPLRFFSELGKTMPLNAAAPAKAMLAYLPEKTRTKLLKNAVLERFTESTICDKEVLTAQFQDILENGVAYCIDELEDYCTAVAVPIFDTAGEIIFGLTVVGHSDRMRQNADAVLAALRSAAQKASAALAECGVYR